VADVICRHFAKQVTRRYYLRMPDSPHVTSAHESGPEAESARENPFKTPLRAAGWWKSSSWTTFAALAVAVIAVAVAIAAWFRPPHSASPTFTGQQTADAKTNLCSAYTTVHQSVVLNTHQENPVRNDPIGQLAVAANARLALVGGGAFLRERIAAEPAAATDLKNAVTSMATTIEQLGTNYLAGASNVVQDPLRRDLNSEINQLNQLCA
jgi:hypothetical protein